MGQRRSFRRARSRHSDVLKKAYLEWALRSEAGQRITGKAGGIVTLFRSGNEAVANRGPKDVFFNGELYAVGDIEDLPDSTTPWREVSDREALGEQFNDFEVPAFQGTAVARFRRMPPIPDPFPDKDDELRDIEDEDEEEM